MVSLADITISRGHEDPAGPDEDLSYLAMESVFTAPEIGRDERRMQVRAYNHWLAAVHNGELPAIEELKPDELADLGPSGVLVDLTLGLSRPAIIFLGERLAAECGEDRDIFNLGDVPDRSLLSRLTEHCLEVVANRSPVGFDAEFIDRQGQMVLYRSILLPYSSDGETVDFVFGVISWKHDEPGARVPEPDPIASAPLTSSPQVVEVLPPPVAKIESDTPPSQLPATLADLLASARALASQVRQAEDRSNRALYAAVSRLHDCALAAQRDPQGLTRLLDAAGLPWQERAPFVGLARLAFGARYPRSRLSEFALVLEFARQRGIGHGELEPVLAGEPGGIKAIASDQRRLRRETGGPGIKAALVRRLRKAPATDLSVANQGEFSLLVARRNSDGTLSVLGAASDVRLLESAAKRLLAS